MDAGIEVQGASAGTAAPSAMIDLTGERESGASVRTAAPSVMIDLTGEVEGRATTSPLQPADLDRLALVDEINALLPRLYLDRAFRVSHSPLPERWWLVKLRNWCLAHVRALDVIEREKSGSGGTRRGRWW
jgi:hypothetical protein